MLLCMQKICSTSLHLVIKNVLYSNTMLGAKCCYFAVLLYVGVQNIVFFMNEWNANDNTSRLLNNNVV